MGSPAPDLTPNVPAAVDSAVTRRRQRLLRVGYGVFLVAVVAFGFIGLRGRWGEIGDAMAALAVWRWFVAFASVTAGLLLTAFVWFRLMQRHGAMVPRTPALVTFFVGQLGKYIPGSLWSMGAQAEMARRYETPARVTVSAGLLFVGVNLASAGGLGAVLALVGDVDTDVPAALFVLAAIVGPLAVSPPVLNRIGAALAPSTHPLRYTLVDSAVTYVLMCATWFVYGLALYVLSPGESDPTLTLAVTTAVFGLAYVVGVVVIIAPAGVGAREATMTALLTPYVGLERSVAAALTIRVLHTAADFAVAAAAWVLAGSEGRPRAGGVRAEAGSVEEP